jgi:hypothetical protein
MRSPTLTSPHAMCVAVCLSGAGVPAQPMPTATNGGHHRRRSCSRASSALPPAPADGCQVTQELASLQTWVKGGLAAALACALRPTGLWLHGHTISCWWCVSGHIYLLAVSCLWPQGGIPLLVLHVSTQSATCSLLRVRWFLPITFVGTSTPAT